MKTRILSLLLCVLMLVSMIPVSVSAAESTAWDGTADDSWYNDTDTEFTLTTAEQLAGLAQLVDGGNTFAGKTIKLGADIDLNKKNWTPIGNDTNYFWGVFDGQEHTISNMTIVANTPSASQFSGLFGGIRKTTIKNFTMTDVNIDVVGAKVRAAAVVGIAYCSENRTDTTINFENITVNGCTISAESKSGSAMVGGIAGYCYPANMKDITVSDLTINGKAEGQTLYASAMAAYVCGQNINSNGGTRAAFTVENFDLDNIVINTDAYTVLAGGYTGESYYGYITLKDGTIDGIKMIVDAHEAFVGSLAGYFWRSDNGHKVENVDTTGIDFDVTTDYLGETRVGGMVGTSQSPNTKYTDCSVQGKIVERCSDSNHPVNYHAKVGGFVARTYEYAMQTYTNCVADVDVTGSNVAGGFVGNHTSTVSYVNCEAKGDVTANIAGGFAGRLTTSYVTSAVAFDKCSASGVVTGEVVAGGFIGSTVNYGWNEWGSDSYRDPYAHNVALNDCVASSKVTGDGLVAGVIGETALKNGAILTNNNVQFTVIPPYLPCDNDELFPDSTLVTPSTTSVTPTITPADAAIEIKDPLGKVVAPEADGSYTLYEGVTYTYTAEQDGFVTSTGSYIAADNKPLTITLHKHVISTAWTYDETGHWHICTAGCDEIFDYAEHTESDWIVDTEPEIGVEGSQHKECAICGYKPMDTGAIPALKKPVFDNILLALVARYAQRFDVLVSADNATVTGDTTIKYKRSGIVEIAPAEGYEIVEVIANGISLGATDKVEFKKVMADPTLVVITAPVAPAEEVEEVEPETTEPTEEVEVVESETTDLSAAE